MKYGGAYTQIAAYLSSGGGGIPLRVIDAFVSVIPEQVVAMTGVVRMVLHLQGICLEML